MTEEKVVLASSLQEKDSCIVQLKEDLDKMTEEKVVLASSLQEKDSCIMQLKEDMDKMTAQLREKDICIEELKQQMAQQMVGQAAQTSSSAHQHETLVTALNEKLVASKTEAEKQRCHIQGLENRLVDKEQGVAGGKEEATLEAEKTIRRLKGELYTVKDKLKLERGVGEMHVSKCALVIYDICL
ncbi:hypothetical protein GWK47_029748 [Chionoecetes opilio]|uniref:Uncharacterized protein n=1 Tax=Chionoecetes opilio TaxID=41210 RepID=A0A8J5D1W9_CHIOP|nr:hypothetical protein GWK47_029748 [Chionoecetes opilio]